MGITSLTGWMIVLFIVLIDWRRERSRSSSTSPSSMPISGRLTGRGLTMVPLSPTIDFSEIGAKVPVVMGTGILARLGGVLALQACPIVSDCLDRASDRLADGFGSHVDI